MVDSYRPSWRARNVRDHPEGAAVYGECLLQWRTEHRRPDADPAGYPAAGWHRWERRNGQRIATARHRHHPEERGGRVRA